MLLRKFGSSWLNHTRFSAKDGPISNNRLDTLVGINIKINLKYNFCSPSLAFLGKIV